MHWCDGISSCNPCNASNLRLIMIVYLLSFTSWLKLKRKKQVDLWCRRCIEWLSPQHEICLYLIISDYIWLYLIISVSFAQNCGILGTPLLCHTHSGWCSLPPLGDTSVQWRKIEQLTTVHPRWPAYTIHSNTGSKNLGFSKKSTNLWG